jgi:hypothetical protein
MRLEEKDLQMIQIDWPKRHVFLKFQHPANSMQYYRKRELSKIINMKMGKYQESKSNRQAWAYEQ